MGFFERLGIFSTVDVNPSRIRQRIQQRKIEEGERQSQLVQQGKATLATGQEGVAVESFNLVTGPYRRNLGLCLARHCADNGDREGINAINLQGVLTEDESLIFHLQATLVNANRPENQTPERQEYFQSQIMYFKERIAQNERKK